MLKLVQWTWRDRNALALLLWPLSMLYLWLARLSRRRQQAQRPPRASLPVGLILVVGYITVGGTGKTPLVIWLCSHLRQRGLRVGVVSRGYGGSSRIWPLEVEVDGDASLTGDEPLLIARRSGCPVVVDPDRTAAVQHLLERHPCDVIISDDGLQHHRLPRDLEIVVIDGERRLGNGFCLPAGPLREPASRLRDVDLVICNGGPQPDPDGAHRMFLVHAQAVALRDEKPGRPLGSFAPGPVHAVAGIGHPPRFFDMLRASGIEPIEHAFRDHHRFTAADICFDDDLPVLMTEKDAVKCQAFADARHWYVPVSAVPDEAFIQALEKRLDALPIRHDSQTGSSHG